MIALKGEAKSEIASQTITFRRARTVSIQTDELRSRYNNEDDLTASIYSEGGQTELVYTLDYLSANGTGTLSDVNRGMAVSGSIALPFSDYAAGGTLVLRAVALVDGVEASPVARQDFAFAAANDQAFLVENITYDSFTDAMQAIEASTGSGILYLQKDVELGSQVLFPNKAITIASTGSALQFVFKADSVQLQDRVTFSNLQYDIGNLYADGHDVTIENTVTAPFAILGHNLFAGAPYGSTTGSTITLSVNGSGNYNIYGSGAMNTTLDSNVQIQIANINGMVARAFYTAVVNGTVTLNGEVLTKNDQIIIGTEGGDEA